MKNLSEVDKELAKYEYESLLKSGMFWEFYPQLVGNWEADCTTWYDEFYNLRRKRHVIPVCNEHGKFQTTNGRWLSISEDLNEHLEFTRSHDAILTKGECPECVTDEQIEIDFSGMRGNNSGEE